MATSLLICVYLLLGVIDLTLLGVGLGQEIWLIVAVLNLSCFVGGLIWYHEYFEQLAEKSNHRVVFTPSVIAFFSLAVSCLLSAWYHGGVWGYEYLFFAGVSFFILFRVFSLFFEVFPLRTKKVEKLLRWTVVGLIALCLPYIQRFAIGDTFLGSLFSPDKVMKSSTIISGSAHVQTASGETGVDSGTILPTSPVGDTLPSSVWKENNTPLTYRTLLSYIDTEVGLPSVAGSIKFDKLASTDAIYPAFSRARGRKMIGTDIDPDRQVRCNNFMIITGLAKGWKIDTTTGVLDAYRTYASDAGLLGSCTTKNQIATEEMLQVIK